MARRLVWSSAWLLASCVCVIWADDIGCAALPHDRSISLGGASICNPLDAWTAAQESASWATKAPPLPRLVGVELLIGVKSSVTSGAAARRAIRDTWANQSHLPVGVRVVFLGCAPVLSSRNASEAQRVREALAAEQVHHGDLLVEELVSCHDTFDDLVNKVLAFFQWSAALPRQSDAATKSFVMVADDDIYVRVDRLITLLRDESVPASRFYGGQVWAEQYQHAIAPRRNPHQNRYYLSLDQYPMSQLPPFANGPHFLLSVDVAHFIGQSRHMFRGVGGDPGSDDSVGSLDDVSVALWLLAMQIRPHHFPQFSNMRDSMCRNDIVSYADLTTTAIYDIHRALRERRQLCHSFSFETWFKPLLPQKRDNDGTRQLLDQWAMLDISIQVIRRTHVGEISISLEFELEDPEHDKLATAVAYPSSASYLAVCAEVALRVATTLGVLKHQYAFFCDQLRRLITELLESSLLQTPTKRVQFAALLHNLASPRVVPQLKMAISSEAYDAIVLMENLLMQGYPGTELQGFNEETMRVDTDGVPDIVIFSTSETSSDEEANAMIRRVVDKYAATSRLVLVHPREPSQHEAIHPRIVAISSLLGSSPSSNQLHVPVASTAFAASIYHSPVDLLVASDHRAANGDSEQPPTFTPASSACRVRQFCVDHYLPGDCEQPHREYFFNLLNALDSVDALGACPQHETRRLQRNQSASTMTKNTAFYLDAKAHLYSRYKFTIAFEDQVNLPGYVSDRIVAAFLAGSIPIYYGHSRTAARLFNPMAFIDCGAFASLRACAKHVLAVHASPALYQSMRQQAPVVDRRAFEETFSWHPDVVITMDNARQRSGGRRAQTLGEQFRALLNNA